MRSSESQHTHTHTHTHTHKHKHTHTHTHTRICTLLQGETVGEQVNEEAQWQCLNQTHD
jgi:hypothetical protein